MSRQPSIDERRRRSRAVTALVAVAVALVSLVTTTPVDAASGGHTASGSDGGNGLWLTAGRDRTGNRNNPEEDVLDTENVDELVERWSFQTGGDVSATPSVDGDRVYVPDFAGNVFALDRDTGAQVWRVSVGTITGIPGNLSRNTPAVSGNLLILGDQGGTFGGHTRPGSGGATVFALDKYTGQLVWKKKIEQHFAAQITQSVQVHGTTGYVGVSSSEETYINPTVYPESEGYVCCSFRGSMVAFDLRTGNVKWKTYTTPQGLSGNAIWGTVPSVDPNRRLVFASTGNNYMVSQEVLDCLAEEPEDPTDCSPPGNYFDAMMAFNMDTGRVVWATAGWESDVWNTDCSPFLNPEGPGPDCPPEYAEGPDYDFGQAPTLLSVRINGRTRDVVGAGQKSGVYWLLDRATGQVIWDTQVGPGGPFGGLQWGSATDGRRIYAAVSNSADLSQPGTYAALDPRTGAILWQIDDPGWRPGENSGQGAVSVANGVVYACSMSPRGEQFALDAATGEVLWTFTSGGSCIAGAAIVDGAVYWGSGYRRWGPPATGNDIFRSFGLP